jgi:hypothetical protein
MALPRLAVYVVVDFVDRKDISARKDRLVSVPDSSKA